MGRRNRRRIGRAHDGLGRRPVAGQLGFRRDSWLHQPIEIEEKAYVPGQDEPDCPGQVVILILWGTPPQRIPAQMHVRSQLDSFVSRLGWPMVQFAEPIHGAPVAVVG